MYNNLYNHSAQEKAPIFFVTGASRSGTTMACRILGGHSQILGMNELHYFGDICEPKHIAQSMSSKELIRNAALLYSRHQYGIWNKHIKLIDIQKAKELIDHLPAHKRNCAGIFSSAVRQLAADAGKIIACEQTPRNIFYAVQLLEYYPESKFVHMIRDPRAVLASQKNRWRRRYLGGSNIPLPEIIRVWFNYHPATISRLWSRANHIALSLMAHPRFHIVKFEDLVADPENIVSDICRFLGVAYEPKMLAVPQVGSSHRMNKEQATGISKDVLNQWQTILDRGEIRLCEYFTRNLMAHFSYAVKTEGHPFKIDILKPLAKYPLHVAGSILSNPRRLWIQLKALRQGSQA